MNRKQNTLRNLALLLVAAVSPTVADTLVISGGTVHTMVGEPVSADVVIRDGVIESVAGVATEEALSGATRIDATGLHIYPGMIDPLSQLGLIEIGAVSATNDRAEMGGYNPHLRSLTALHPSSELIPVARANGVTHALIAPQGDEGVVVGQAGLVQLDGWTVEEMTLASDVAMMIDWPQVRTRRFDFSTFTIKETPFKEAQEKADEKKKELAEWIAAARHYGQARAAGSQRLKRDRRLESLADALEMGQRMIIKAQSKRDIEAAIEFAEEHELNIVLAGGRDAWEVADLLAEKEIPMILGFTQSLPRNEDDPYDRPFQTPGVLVEAGVRISFASGAGGGFGPGGPHSARTLPYEAATAVAYGLDAGDALRALTIWPAEMLGVDDRLGSVEVGKLGNLMITDGDPLEITTAVRHVIIGGREVSTANRHRDLYEKYRAR